MRILIIFIHLFFLSIWSVVAYTSSQFLAAKNLGERGVIVSQESLNLYRLDETMTRKEFMKVLANQVWDEIENECNYEFWDVRNDWGCKYIEWAMKKAFVAHDRYFRPNQAVTKSEAMKLILKARDIERIQKTSDWRVDDMQTAFKKWIIENKYSDYDNLATRWWIFEALATSEGLYVEKAESDFYATLHKIRRYRFEKDIFIWID